MKIISLDLNDFTIFRAFRDYKIDIESKNGTIIAQKKTVETDSLIKNKRNETDKSDSIKRSLVYFKVQIASSSSQLSLDSEIFKEYDNPEEFSINNTYKYAVGIKSKYEDIVEYCKRVKIKYPDAFIIAVKEGQIISVQQALQEVENK